MLGYLKKKNSGAPQMIENSFSHGFPFAKRVQNPTILKKNMNLDLESVCWYYPLHKHAKIQEKTTTKRRGAVLQPP